MDKNLKLWSHKRIFQILVLVILSLIVYAPQRFNHVAYAKSVTAQISAEDQMVHRGQTFDVDVKLSENTGLLTLFLTVKFDHNVFKLINVQQVKQALSELNMEQSGSGYDYVDENTGGFNLFWDGSKPDIASGTIVKLTFESSLNADIGTYPIELVVDEGNTTIAYGVNASVQVSSPQISLIEGRFIVVWHDWKGEEVENLNITGHPYNENVGGYVYNSEESLNDQTDFPDNPSRPEDNMYYYEFEGWQGAVWNGFVPEDSYVIYYVTKYKRVPKTYVVSYYVDGYGDNNVPNREIVEEEFYTGIATSYGSIIDDRVLPYKKDYTFYGWYTDPGFTNRLTSPLMPAKNIRLYGYFKYNIRETDIPVIQLVYRETEINENLENIAYVDVNITKNYGLNSLMITLSSFDTTAFTFCGFEKGEIFNQMTFTTTEYNENNYPQNFNFLWENSSNNYYEIGRLLVLKFRVNPNSDPGAYEVVMTSNNKNTTYLNFEETWYSNIDFINTKIAIGRTNYWNVPVEDAETNVEVSSSVYVPYNVELIVEVVTENVETIIENDSLRKILNENMTVQSLFEIYFQQNATRLTNEQFSNFFGSEKIIVKIKLTTLQISCKHLDVYYIDDNGEMHLYESKIEKGYLIFETNHFSHWALIGDNVITNVETTSMKLLRVTLILFGISASALIAIAFVRDRKGQYLIAYQKNRKRREEN